MSLPCAYARVRGAKREAAGVALSPRNEGTPTPLTLQNLEGIIDAGSGFDPFKRAMALAAINAVGQYALARENPETAADLRALIIEKILENSTQQTRIAVIGYLRPVVERLKREGRQVEVFCREYRNPQEGVYNDIFEYEAVGEAEIMLITGAALIGSTVDALIALSPKARMRILSGFSAGVYPAWLEGSGITHVASLQPDLAIESALLRNDWERLFACPAYWLEVTP